MNCPHCQIENTEKAKAYIDCGNPLQIAVVCSECQHINKAIVNLCEESDYPLEISHAPKIIAY